MKYTISKEGNQKVKKDMEIICKEILKNIKNVYSILLTGGFSRGEGPVKIEKIKIFPYNDYDIQVICKNKISKEESDKISIEISNMLGYKGIANFYPFKKEDQKMKNNFYIDLKCDTPGDLKKMLPRIRTYELRNKSVILYGKDLRNLIPNYKLENIPLSEGAKLLLDRMSQMIEYYSTEDKYEKEFLTYIIQQAYAACCTSLLLLNRKYEIGYVKSMNILKKTYKIDFPELSKKIPELTKKIEQFVRWKVNPNKLPSKDIKKEWFIAKKNIIEISKFFFSNFLKKDIKTTGELSNSILNMKKEFYNPYLKEILPLKILHPLIIPLARKGALITLNKKYNKRLREMKVNFKTGFFVSPDLVIFSSLIYLIESIDEKSINEEMLEKGKRLLGKVYPVKGKNWEEISIDYANAYIAFFLQKI